jgi:hypothetical protein
MQLDAPTYRESRAFVPPPLGPLILVGTLALLGYAVVDALRGHGDLLLNAPGLIAFVAIGLVAALARLNVDVHSDRVVVGNTARLSRTISWQELLGVTIRSSAPSRFALTWPWTRRRIYTIRDEGGVELTLADGEVVFLGSSNPAALAQAIRSAAPHLTIDHGTRMDRTDLRARAESGE